MAEQKEKHINPVTEIAKFTPKEREAYEESLKYYRDIKNVVDTSKEEGLKEGIEKGIKKGIRKGIKEVAKKMKSKGISNLEIQELTGLDLDIIENL